jgi:hypothetical protein
MLKVAIFISEGMKKNGSMIVTRLTTLPGSDVLALLDKPHPFWCP